MRNKLRSIKIPILNPGIKSEDLINSIHKSISEIYDEMSSQKVIRYNAYIVDEGIDLIEKQNQKLKPINYQRSTELKENDSDSKNTIKRKMRR